MNKTLKSGKKVLSLVLSVLMIMSCFVFAPVANAATNKVVIRVDLQEGFYLPGKYNPKKTSLEALAKTIPVVLTVNYEDGTVDEINLIYDKETGKSIVTADDYNNIYQLKNFGYDTVAFTRTASAAIRSIQLTIGAEMNRIANDDGNHANIILQIEETGKPNKNTAAKYLGNKFNKTVIYGDSVNPIVYVPTKIEFTVAPKTLDAKNETSVSGQFTAKVYDQTGKVMTGKTITYSVNNGAEITANGLATFTEVGIYTVTATCGSLKATTDVTVSGLHVHDFVWEVTKPATCVDEGSKSGICACGYTTVETIPATGHTPAAAVKENVEVATCEKDGSHDEVVYCAVCEIELSRETITDKATGHTPAAAVKENEVAANCGKDGSHDEVVYCEVCGNELSRETVTDKATGHTPAAAVKENVEAATCEKDGSHDEVVYCEVCGNELSRETVTDKATGHTPAAAVKENVDPATCTENGTHDMVVYCTVCNIELKRETITDEKALGHAWGKWEATEDGKHMRVCGHDKDHVEVEAHDFKDVVTPPTCLTEGFTTHTCSKCGNSNIDSYVPASGHKYGKWVDDGNGETHSRTCTVCDETVSEHKQTKDHTIEIDVEAKAPTCGKAGCTEGKHCTTCDYEVGSTVIPATGEHTPAAAVNENEVAATCSEEGSYDEVVYCSVCGAEISRETKKIDKIAHTPAKAVKENEVAATCSEEGSYDEVVYCSVCGVEISRNAKTGESKLNHNYLGKITFRPTTDKKGLATYTCQNDASHVYTLEMDLADYSAFDKSLKELEEIAKKDLNAENRALVDAALAEAAKLPRNLIAGVKGQKYEDAKDQYKHDFGEQNRIGDATAKLDEVIKKINDQGDNALNKYKITFNWYGGSETKKYLKGATVEVPTVGNYTYGGFTYEFLGWDKAVVPVVADATYTARYTEPRSMDDVIEAEKKADDIIGNKDYYEEDRNKVEEAKKELDDYLDEKDVEIDENGNVINNPITKGSEEDKRITELVEKLNDAINAANKNKAERDKMHKNTSGFLGWLTRLLILVRHLLSMV